MTTIAVQKELGTAVGLSNGVVLYKTKNDTSEVLCTGERVVAVVGTASYLIVACASKQVKSYDWNTGTLLGERSAARRPAALCFAENPTALLVACGGELYAWSLPAFDQEKWLLGHTSSILTSVRLCDGLLATCDRNEKARISLWPQTAIIQTYCLGHSAFVSRCVFINGNKRLATCGGDASLRLWDTSNGSELASALVSQVLTCLEISPDMSTLIVAAEASSTLRLFNSTNLEPLRELDAPSTPVDMLFVSNDILLLALDDPSTILTNIHLATKQKVNHSNDHLPARILDCANLNQLTPHLKALHALDVPVDSSQPEDDQAQQQSTPSLLMKHQLPIKYDPTTIALPDSTSKNKKRQRHKDSADCPHDEEDPSSQARAPSAEAVVHADAAEETQN